MNLSEPLISWYMRHKRDLPWRNTKDPYRIWLSEIILQQTRVEQGITYYFNIVNTFPTVGMLAEEPVDKLLKLWQGLGYYSRARNMHSTAVYIHNELNGIFPRSYQELLDLKGVGPYTAAAIASFAFKLPHAAVDGNVSRVLSRIHNIDLPINTAAGQKLINALAEEALPRERPDDHNQAMMELGATVCTPKQPKCPSCPLQDLCASYAAKNWSQRPVKLKRAKQRIRHMDYAVVETEGTLILRRRKEKDIWQGLHDFISAEGEKNIVLESLSRVLQDEIPEIRILSLPSEAEYQCTHILTHQKIEARFWRIKAEGTLKDNSIYLSVPKMEIGKVAVPRLIHKYLEHAQWL